MLFWILNRETLKKNSEMRNVFRPLCSNQKVYTRKELDKLPRRFKVTNRQILGKRNGFLKLSERGRAQQIKGRELRDTRGKCHISISDIHYFTSQVSLNTLKRKNHNVDQRTTTKFFNHNFQHFPLISGSLSNW